MELDDLKNLWREQEKQLQENWALNFELLRTLNLDKAKSRLKSLARVAMTTLIFYIAAALYFIYFTIEYGTELHFALAGGVLSVWAITIAAGAMQQLGSISAIDYSEPIPILQRKLELLKIIVLRYIRIGAWIIPFYFSFIIVGFKSLFGVDILSVGDSTWLMVQAGITLAFIPLTIWIYRKLSPKNIDAAWMQKVLKGNGSQITDSLIFLKDIERFEMS